MMSYFYRLFLAVLVWEKRILHHLPTVKDTYLPTNSLTLLQDFT